jgi:hypothetical protein
LLASITARRCSICNKSQRSKLTAFFVFRSCAATHSRNNSAKSRTESPCNRWLSLSSVLEADTGYVQRQEKIMVPGGGGRTPKGSRDICQAQKPADRGRPLQQSFLVRTVSGPELTLRLRANQDRRTSQAFGSLAPSDIGTMSTRGRPRLNEALRDQATISASGGLTISP